MRTMMGFIGLALFVVCSYGVFLVASESKDYPAPQCEKNEAIWWVNGQRDCIDMDILCKVRCP